MFRFCQPQRINPVSTISSLAAHGACIGAALLASAGSSPRVANYVYTRIYASAAAARTEWRPPHPAPRLVRRLRIAAPLLPAPRREAAPLLTPPEIRATVKPPTLPLAPVPPLSPAPQAAFEGAAPGVPSRETPRVRTGGFAAASARAASAAPEVLASAGFEAPRAEAGGHPHGAPRTGSFGDAMAAVPAAAAVADTRTAGFDVAAPGGATRPLASQILGAGFGAAVAVTQTSSPAPLKASAGFAAATTAEPPRGAAPAASAAPALTVIEIVFKPRPVYTEEARKLSIQGDVVLLAWFRANGQVDVNHVLRGLGHGLDESAIRAAEAIRFRPATEYGRPVDASATVRITFQLAN